LSARSPERIAALGELARELRVSIIRTTHRAGCGHTGGSLSEVEILTALYFELMNIDPARPDWPERDRFILSKGHCTPGYYSALAKRGYFSEDLLATFDEVDSLLQGHPDMRKTPGVDMSTGSLGQGLSVGIGMALGGEANGQSFQTYVLLGCGEIQEGQVWEAAMYAGNHRVPRLVAILDYNKVQLTGATESVLSLQPVVDKWSAFAWEVLECDGHDLASLLEALDRARSLSARRPVILIAHTVKGKGVSFMENRFEWHAKAPSDAEAEQAIREILSA
jgi:transketolase